MNTKTLILASFLMIGTCTWQAQASTYDTSPIIGEENLIPNGYEEIVLQGELLLGVGPNAVEAGANENSVYIGFNQDFSNVSISIYNGAGLVVYSTVVNTSVQQVVIIPFTSAANGSYTVELSSANGYAEGSFDNN